MANKEQMYLINLREGLQTPAKRSPYDIPSVETLPPPAVLLLDKTVALFEEVKDEKDTYIELQTPASCPSAAKFDYILLQEARKRGMIDRVPLHVRMTKSDMELALLVGATAIHGMGNSLSPEEGRGKKAADLLNNLDEMEPLLLRHGVNHFRASLEHALHTSPTTIEELIKGLWVRNQDLKQKHGRSLYTALGIPDTRGDGTQEKFTELIKMIGNSGYMEGMKIFIHLHKDNGEAIENAQAIIEAAKEFNLQLVIEVASDGRFTGERNGILDPNDLQRVTGKSNFPQMANGVLVGSSWRDGIGTYSYEDAVEIANNTNVAGIHTDASELYGNGNGWPAPGLYGVMGKMNIAFIQEHVLNVPAREDQLDAFRAAALLGRELATQSGNKPQKFAIQLAQLTLNEPKFVIKVAESFGKPTTWLDKPLPDLDKLRKLLGMPEI
jgi:hypothetical protein